MLPECLENLQGQELDDVSVGAFELYQMVGSIKTLAIKYREYQHLPFLDEVEEDAFQLMQELIRRGGKAI